MWKAALGLLDRYAPSTICRHVRLNAGRFKQVREARGAVAEESGHVRRGGSGAGVGGLRKVRHGNSASEPVFSLAPSRNAFVELPRFGVGFGGGIIPPALGDAERGAAEQRVLRDMEGDLPELEITQEVWSLAYEMARRARRQGKTVPASDILIAACARHHGVELEHANGHFDMLAAIP